METDRTSHPTGAPQVAGTEQTGGAAQTEMTGQADAAGEVSVQVPEFSNLQDSGQRQNQPSLDRFLDVNVTVSAELGRVSLPIGELLQLGEGSVLKLGRSLAEPVDLVAQGVRLGRGEVVVVNDCFAIRIKEIESARK